MRAGCGLLESALLALYDTFEYLDGSAQVRRPIVIRAGMATPD